MEDKIKKIVEVLKKNEFALSDGYEHYCGRWGVDNILKKVATKILDELELGKYEN